MTEGDPFYTDFFVKWFEKTLSESVPAPEEIRICEPYAGKLSLVAHLGNALSTETASRLSWSAYDIAPPPEDDLAASGVEIMEANTLFTIPGAPYDAIVTNPPYLARNSASRRGLDFPFDAQGVGMKRPADLYQFALDACLASAPVCVMLIPESFITSSYDKTRCDAVISLRGDLFADTDCPVCLALFSARGPADGKTIIVGNDGKRIGALEDILAKSKALLGDARVPLSMNDPNGDVALFGADSTSGATIRFARGDEIPSSSVKVSSRFLTRISRRDGKAVPDEAIAKANDLLAKWREDTSDVLMTAFKGVRKDGRYRRRLAYREAAGILSRAISEIGDKAI